MARSLRRSSPPNSAPLRTPSGVTCESWREALPASQAVGDLRVREHLSPDDKIELGKVGATMIQPGQVVMLDGGTTALQIARAICRRGLRATLVTQSPNIAVEAAACASVEIVVLGGRLFRHSMVTRGRRSSTQRQNYGPISIHGCDRCAPTEGLTPGYWEEPSVKRALHRRAAETIVLASTEEMMAASAYVMVSLDTVSLFVGPDSTPAKVARTLRTGVVQVLRSGGVRRTIRRTMIVYRSK